jgi:hypothetical protein
VTPSDTTGILGYVLEAAATEEIPMPTEIASVGPGGQQGEQPNIHDILERFSLARSLLFVCHRSLRWNDAPDGPGHEADVLEEVIEKFRQVYNELDEYAGALSPSWTTP